MLFSFLTSGEVNFFRHFVDAVAAFVRREGTDDLFSQKVFVADAVGVDRGAGGAVRRFEMKDENIFRRQYIFDGAYVLLQVGVHFVHSRIFLIFPTVSAKK